MLLKRIVKGVYILFISNAKFNIKLKENTVVLWVTKLSDLKFGYQQYGATYSRIFRVVERILLQNDGTNQSQQMPLPSQVILI